MNKRLEQAAREAMDAMKNSIELADANVSKTYDGKPCRTVACQAVYLQTVSAIDALEKALKE